MVPFDRPHTISYQISIATMSLSSTVSETLSLILKTQGGHVSKFVLFHKVWELERFQAAKMTL